MISSSFVALLVLSAVSSSYCVAEAAPSPSSQEHFNGAQLKVGQVPAAVVVPAAAGGGAVVSFVVVAAVVADISVLQLLLLLL